MLENIREAFDGIRSHKLRSALTMLGIIIGIASIIAISSTIMGTNEQIKQNLVGSGSNVVTVRLYQGDYPFESSWTSVPDYVPALTQETLEEIRSADRSGTATKRSAPARSTAWTTRTSVCRAIRYARDAGLRKAILRDSARSR